MSEGHLTQESWRRSLVEAVTKRKRLEAALREIIELYERPESGRRKTAAMIARKALGE